ncbi:beta strand repeat-containing protein [Marichromatium gracile]|uniref:Hemolysin type calcium-binding protein n=1 Tax=Marichromatium gracile TaxID=1048 RepID=A0A4R4AJU3_MARGR|nr:calcium-binding protein [Marichromatium gracile]MBK1709919.1 hypothetical protein [Marichromatium gracile]TCW39672.1 hypothetical protein EDC29_10184 [Marichromatium gracile]
MALQTFVQEYYLQQNPDVLQAVLQGVFTSAEQHYTLYGEAEGRQPNPYFEPTGYYTQNPDVLAAVQAGAFSSALEHFEMYGATEGRQPGADTFNEATYLADNPDVQAAVDAGTFTSGYQHFVLYGANEGRASGGSESPSTGETFTLTAGVDNLVGTAGDDTFIGDSASISPADTIDGRAGTDRADLFLSDDETLNATGVEQFFIQSTGDDTFNAASVEGAEEFWSNRSSDTLTVSNIQNNATLGLLDTDETFNAEFRAGVIGDDGTLNIATDSSDATVNIDAGTGNTFTTLAVAAVNGSSVIEIDGGVASYTSIETSGEGSVSLSDDTVEFDSVTSVDLQAAGGSYVDLEDNALDVTVTAGAGDDAIEFGAGEFNTDDSVDLGEGDNTLVLGDADLSTNAIVTAVNAASGVSTLASTATTDVVANVGELDDVSTIAAGLGGSVTGSAATGGNAPVVAADAAAAVTINGIASSGDSVNVTNDLTGGQATAGTGGGDDAGNAAAGLELNMGTDGANDSVSISITGNSSTIEGGQGVAAGGGDTAGEAGVGIDAREFETVNISADEDLTVARGAANGGTAATEDTLVGANATVNITGDSDVDLGTVASAAADASNRNLTINAEELTGDLTVTTGDGNDTIVGGDGDDDIAAGAGVNTLTGGAGRDEFNIDATDNSTVADHSTITDFQAGRGGDTIDGGAAAYDDLTASQRTTVSEADTLDDAVVEALGFTDNTNWTAFEYDGKTYALFDGDDNATFDQGTDIIVELSGVAVADVTVDNFV